MHRILQATPLPEYRLEIHFADGVRGEADLSHMVGSGVFSAWKDLAFFRNVTIGEAGQLCWGESIDLCPDTLYMQITGKKPEELFPDLQRTDANA